MKLITALTFALLLTLSGCGESDITGPATSDDAQPRLYDESEIVEHLGLVDDGSGTDSYIYRGPGQIECNIPVVLKSSDEVALYANAGDNVASNSIGSAGVKFNGDELASCQEALTEALADLE